jgi:hypothetical protein
MFGFIMRQSSSVGAQPRPDLAFDTIGEARRSSAGPRHAIGRALVTIGQRVAGEMPAGRPSQSDGECA